MILEKVGTASNRESKSASLIGIYFKFILLENFVDLPRATLPLETLTSSGWRNLSRKGNNLTFFGLEQSLSKPPTFWCKRINL